jgi:hypothetical protein
MKTCTSVRSKFAELLRAFYLGRITNDEFEDAVEPLCEQDPVVHEVFHLGAWRTYSDHKECRFTDYDKLTPEGRKILARWILFLKGGKPYLWPKVQRLHLPAWVVFTTLLSGIPLAVLTGFWQLTCIGFGFLVVCTIFFDRREQKRVERSFDFSVWPFISEADFKEALQHPSYLSGRSVP